MIEVHGAEAATVARNNARAAALGGKAMPPRGLGDSLPSVPASNSTQG
jgi:hypothetical protein